MSTSTLVGVHASGVHELVTLTLVAWLSISNAASPLPLPTIPYEAHSFNDIDVWPQLLGRGVRWFKLDFGLCTQASCSQFSTWGTVAGRGNHSDCVTVENVDYCCICMRGDTSTRPDLTSPFNTTWDMIAFLADPENKHLFPAAASDAGANVDASEQAAGSGQVQVHQAPPPPIMIGLDYGGTPGSANIMDGNPAAPILRNWILSMAAAIEGAGIGVVPYLDAGTQLWWEALDQQCAKNPSLPNCNSGPLAQIRNLPWPIAVGDQFPPMSQDPAGRYRILNSEFTDANFGTDCNTSSWDTANTSARAAGFPYLWYEPSSQDSILDLLNSWSTCASVPAGKRSLNDGIAMVSNLEPEMVEVLGWGSATSSTPSAAADDTADIRLRGARDTSTTPVASDVPSVGIGRGLDALASDFMQYIANASSVKIAAVPSTMTSPVTAGGSMYDTWLVIGFAAANGTDTGYNGTNVFIIGWNASGSSAGVVGTAAPSIAEKVSSFQLPFAGDILSLAIVPPAATASGSGSDQAVFAIATAEGSLVVFAVNTSTGEVTDKVGPTACQLPPGRLLAASVMDLSSSTSRSDTTTSVAVNQYGLVAALLLDDSLMVAFGPTCDNTSVYNASQWTIDTVSKGFGINSAAIAMLNNNASDASSSLAAGILLYGSNSTSTLSVNSNSSGADARPFSDAALVATPRAAAALTYAADALREKRRLGDYGRAEIFGAQIVTSVALSASGVPAWPGTVTVTRAGAATDPPVRLGFGSNPHLAVHPAINATSGQPILDPSQSVIFESHTDGTCACGWGLNNADFSRCFLMTPAADANPWYGSIQQVQSLLNYNVGPLSSWLAIVTDGDAITAPFSMCSQRLVHGKWESGIGVSTALFPRLVQPVISSNSTASHAAGSSAVYSFVPNGPAAWEIGMLALHDGRAPEGTLTAIVCGAPDPKPGWVWTQFQVLPGVP